MSANTALEINEHLGADLLALFKTFAYLEGAEIKKDMSGKERMMRVQKKSNGL